MGIELENITGREAFTVLLILLILFGLLGLPLILQHFYGVNPIKVAFIVIIIYAIINWKMKNQI